MTSLWFLCLLGTCPAPVPPAQAEDGAASALGEWAGIVAQMDCSGESCEIFCYDFHCGPSEADFARATQTLRPYLREAIDHYRQQLEGGCVPAELSTFLRVFRVRTTRLRDALVALAKQRYLPDMEAPLLHFLRGSHPKANAWLVALAGRQPDSSAAYQSLERLLTFAFEHQVDPPGLPEVAVARFHRPLLQVQPERLWDAVVRRWPEAKQHPERMNLARFLGQAVGVGKGALAKALALVGKEPLLRAAVLVAALRAAPARSVVATESALAWLEELSSPEGEVTRRYTSEVGWSCGDPLCERRGEGQSTPPPLEETLWALDPQQLPPTSLATALEWLLAPHHGPGSSLDVHPGWRSCLVERLDATGRPRQEVLRLLLGLRTELLPLYPTLSRPLDDDYQSELVTAVSHQLPAAAPAPARAAVGRMVRSAPELRRQAWGSLLYHVGGRQPYATEVVAALVEVLPRLSRGQYQVLPSYASHLTAHLDAKAKDRLARAIERYWRDRPQDPFLRLCGLAFALATPPLDSQPPRRLFEAVPSVPLATRSAYEEVLDLLRGVMLQRLEIIGKEAALVETRELTRPCYGRSPGLDDILREVERIIATYQPFCFSC
jgi:hypothetical protein